MLDWWEPKNAGLYYKESSIFRWNSYKSLCSNEIIDCFMVLIFSELLRVFQYDSSQSNSKSLNNTPVIEILNYLEKNYMTCTLISTAKHFNFHPNYLSNLIKRTTKRSFSEIILLQKLTRASILLENTDIPIYGIENEIGYNTKRISRQFYF